MPKRIRPRVFDFVIAVGERLTFPPGALKSLRALRPRYGAGTRSAKENDGRQRGGIKRAEGARRKKTWIRDYIPLEKFMRSRFLGRISRAAQ